MKLTAWGKFPIIDSTVILPNAHLAQELDRVPEIIPFGNGRSYGDSALSSHIVPMTSCNRYLDFNLESGLLTCESGVLLADIIDVFVPRGWFLKVTPGTKLITVGGAIASDVHGKNHHIEGCFSECVKSFSLMLADGRIVCCSREENLDLFRATCGGMGLTGIILEVSFYLKRITSQQIGQTTIKTANLAETFAAFEEYGHQPYSVAWIDCLAKKTDIGRCLLMVGDFLNDGDLNYTPKKKMSIPFEFPGFALNSLSVRAFNWFYYGKVRERISHSQVDIDSFFYPLDALNNWNRIYGKGGFTQYQFILPKERSFEGLNKILSQIADSGKGSFLAVLKLYGPANENYLSFPMEGYSLALDFKIEPGLFELLDKLDEIVVHYGGRIYLTKDVRVSRNIFTQGYPMLDKFREVRSSYGLSEKFNSLQSQRLGI
ncbi:FAD-binding oxidoreductase [Desulfuromonas acetexigens]|uniref:FAD-binding oxidoreductase n=1 Tax=Trichloromonas acetexigens TaxID=38815 RepID=A0A550JHM9_9BACT|nr:FAD-binding oxidoreductase [Desulfuromonas acetexigens]TRO82712.1 FAD-binding oxidoreductase [Desulfuromonas acetexigens]